MSNVSLLTDSFVIKFDGTALTTPQDLALQSVVVEQTWSTADRIEIRFDDNREDAPDINVGAAVRAEIVSDAATTLLFEGEITAIGIEWNYETRTVVYEGYDKRHKLTRQITPTTYEMSSLADVVSSIASRNGASATTPAWMSQTQYPTLVVASSDFATLQQIARLTGCEWTFTGGNIVFDDRKQAKTATVTLTPNDLTDFDLRFTPIERAKDIEVHGWDPVNKQAITGKAAAMPRSRHTVPDALGSTRSLTQNTAMSWSPGSVDQRHAEQHAESIGQRLRDAEVTGRAAMTGNANIRPGIMVEIEGLSPRANGKYTISSAQHVYGSSWGSLMTHFRIGPVDSGLADLIVPATGSSNTITHGVTIGVVTEIDNTGDSKAPPGVRVKLPFLSDTVQTGWARLMSTGGGPDRGVVFPPEVGDEVLVAFEHGDINRPYVLGTVWNNAGGAFTGTINGNVAEERRIVSKLKNKLRLIDKAEGDAESGIALEVDEAKTRLFFGYKETTIETKDRPFKLKNGQASILLDQDEITITANKITLKSAVGDVMIDANNIKAKAKVAFEAEAATVKVKASGLSNVEAGGLMTVKGSMVKIN